MGETVGRQPEDLGGRRGGVTFRKLAPTLHTVADVQALVVALVLLLVMTMIAVVAMLGAVLWGLGSALGFPVGMSAAGDEPEHAAARVSVVPAPTSTASTRIGSIFHFHHAPRVRPVP